MKINRSLGLILVLLLGLSVSAQKPDVTQAGLRKTIEYLASDKLEGRRTGTPGATLAAQYVENMFRTYGLKPGARSKTGAASYLQLFPYVTGVEMTKADSFTLSVLQKDGRRITIKDMLPVKPVGFSPNGSVNNASVVFAGFGIDSTEPKFDDYAGESGPIDVRGKVAIVFDGNPKNDDPHSPFIKYDVRSKANIAKAHGAVGMLVISREKDLDADPLSKLRYDQTLGEAALPTFVISRNTAANILGVQEEALISMEQFAAAKVDTTLKVNIHVPNVDPVVSFNVALVKKQVPAYNVIGVLPGTDPKLRGEAIVIGAHYDHLGHGGQGSLAANSTAIHHGADDNASGTAAIIELARLFSREHKNKRTLVFIAFSGEEEGLYGSNYYVDHPVFPIGKTIAMFNLDMVGRLNEKKLTIGGIGTSDRWKKLVEDHDPADRSSGGSLFELQLNEEGFGPSDHSSFYGKRVPVLFFFTGTHNDYHKPSDTADKINYAGEAEIVDYIRDLAKAVDADPTRPVYEVAKSSPTSQRSGFTISLGTIPNYAEGDNGLKLDGVRDASPAAKAGIKAGDVVIKLNAIDVRNISDYMFAMGTMHAGKEYEVVVRRGTEMITLKIVPDPAVRK